MSIQSALDSHTYLADADAFHSYTQTYSEDISASLKVHDFHPISDQQIFTFKNHDCLALPFPNLKIID